MSNQAEEQEEEEEEDQCVKEKDCGETHRRCAGQHVQTNEVHII